MKPRNVPRSGDSILFISGHIILRGTISLMTEDTCHLETKKGCVYLWKDDVYKYSTPDTEVNHELLTNMIAHCKNRIGAAMDALHFLVQEGKVCMMTNGDLIDHILQCDYPYKNHINAKMIIISIASYPGYLDPVKKTRKPAIEPARTNLSVYNNARSSEDDSKNMLPTVGDFISLRDQREHDRWGVDLYRVNTCKHCGSDSGCMCPRED